LETRSSCQAWPRLDRTNRASSGAAARSQSGVSTPATAPRAAAPCAATLIAASEGAVVLNQAKQRLEPFDLVAAHLLDQVRLLQG
jgi:hypothetical protein